MLANIIKITFISGMLVDGFLQTTILLNWTMMEQKTNMEKRHVGIFLDLVIKLLPLGINFMVYCSISQAEYQACRDGLLCVLWLGIHRFIIEGDLAMIVYSIRSSRDCNWKFRTLKTDIVNLLKLFQQYHVQHAYREANGSAYRLAKRRRTSWVQQNLGASYF